jgi:DUF4097 and DUF4098 domain-containing protein YvlB
VRASKVGLLLLILIAGAAVETAWSVRHDVAIGPGACVVLGGKFRGPSFAFDDEERRAAPEGGAVEVENAFGSVRVVAGGPGEVLIRLRKIVYLPTEQRAREFAGLVRVEAEATSDATLRVRTNRARLERGEGRRVGFETHLELTVPPRTAVRVQNDHGRVEVEDARRADVSASYESVRIERVAEDASVRSRHGDVTVAGVGGALSLTARHGSAEARDVAGRATIAVRHGGLKAARVGGLEARIRHGDLAAQSVRGELLVDGDHAAVEAEDVTGRAVVETSFRDVDLRRVGGDVEVRARHGAVRAEEVDGAVKVATSFDGVTLSGVRGAVEVRVQHGGVSARALERGAKIEASGDDVILDGVRGPVTVETRRGAVRLVPAGALTEPVSVRTEHGDIDLTVPPESRFDIEASVARGELVAEVPGLVRALSGADRIEGKVGGGGHLVRLEARGGDVRLGSTADAAARGR